jgi:hypothetical protein
MPDNPWPHDMVIRVEEPSNIDELLFIRSAWAIASDALVPPLEPEPDPGDSACPSSASIEEWSARWHRAWTRAWQWYAIADQSFPTQAVLRSLSVPGQPLHPSFPPFWSVEHGRDGIDLDAFGRWQGRFREHEMRPFDEEPERVCLASVIAAWQRGLTTVLTMPYSGYFAERIAPQLLVVSLDTRNHPESYDSALAELVR